MSKYIPQEITHIEASADGFVYTSLLPLQGETNIIVCWKKMH
jgi:hypothetical protein